MKVCHLPGVMPQPQTPLSLVPSPHRSNKVDPNLNPLSSFSAVDGRTPRERGTVADDGQTRSPNLEAETSAADQEVNSIAPPTLQLSCKKLKMQLSCKNVGLRNPKNATEFTTEFATEFR